MSNSRPDKAGYGSWNASGAGTNAGVTVTHTVTTNATCFVTGIQCSGDAAALVTVESPASTVLWRKRFAAAFNFSEQFPATLAGAAKQNILVKISASTTNCEANLQGYDA